jgi:hypothetical protein
MKMVTSSARSAARLARVPLHQDFSHQVLGWIDPDVKIHARLPRNQVEHVDAARRSYQFAVVSHSGPARVDPQSPKLRNELLHRSSTDNRPSSIRTMTPAQVTGLVTDITRKMLSVRMGVLRYRSWYPTASKLATRPCCATSVTIPADLPASTNSFMRYGMRARSAGLIPAAAGPSCPPRRRYLRPHPRNRALRGAMRISNSP